MEHQRFALEWDHPSLPDAATHVSLFDGGKAPLNIVASGHGAGEVHALSDLLATLTERRESPEAIAFVSEDTRADGEYAGAPARMSASLAASGESQTRPARGCISDVRSQDAFILQAEPLVFAAGTR